MRIRESAERFDVLGAVTLTAAMVTLVFGIVTVGEAPGDPLGITGLVVGVALFVAFGVIERRVTDPLIPPGVLGKGLLPWTSLVGLLFIGAFFSWQFLLTLYLQQLLGWGPLETGLSFAAMGVEVVIAPWLTPWLTGRFGNVPVMVAGLVSVAGGQPQLGDYQRAIIVPAIAAGLALIVGIATLVRHRGLSQATG